MKWIKEHKNKYRLKIELEGDVYEWRVFRFEDGEIWELSGDLIEGLGEYLDDNDDLEEFLKQTISYIGVLIEEKIKTMNKLYDYIKKF